MSDTLKGKVALITGAGSEGMGRAICLRLAEQGADIIAFDIDKAGLDRTAAELGRFGNRVHIAAVDITQEAALDAAVDQAIAALGEIDILINCAGGAGKTGAILDTSVEGWDQVFDLNVRAPFRLIQRLAPAMIARRSGRIINITSASAHRANLLSAYASAKAALMQLTRCAAAEFGPYDVNVNAIAPGLTKTPILPPEFTDAEIERQVREGSNANLLSRVSLPDDIADATLFLCLPASRQITAQTIHVSAGSVV